MWKLRLKQSYIDYFLVTWMFCISGNPAFTDTYPLGKILYGVSLLIIMAIMGFKMKVSTFRTCAIWGSLMLIIFAAHYIQFRYITILGSFNFAARMLCAILFATYLGERLPDRAINVMAVVCLLSFPLFILNSCGIYFTSPINTELKSEIFVIYTQNKGNDTNELFRNSGMFWEPGAFAGYIMMTLMLFIDKLKMLLTKYRIQFIILSIALLTTMSTTGYVLYGLFFIYFVFSQLRKRAGIIPAIVAAGVFIAGFALVFNKVDFLGDKIRRELDVSSTLTEDDANPSRTGSMIYDMQYIMTHPLFGNGLAAETRHRFHLELFIQHKLDGLGNGFSGIIASMGLVFIFAFFITIARNGTLKNKWALILLIILILQGEQFLNLPFCMMFPFVNYGSLPDAESRSKTKVKWKLKVQNT